MTGNVPVRATRRKQAAASGAPAATATAATATASTAASAQDVASQREQTAQRLLRSTAARSYDPELEVDWSVPPVPGLSYVLEERCSLYGTRLWRSLSPEQRLDLGRHEAASVASVGIWFEVQLMRMLTKLAYEGDATTRHVQYAFTEVADECRHSTMFARMIEWMDAPAYGPPRAVHRRGRVLPQIAQGPTMWGAILIGEELVDRFQREMVGDERIQPLMRMVNRIHIVEESRHVGFARAELLRTASATPRWQLPYHRLLLAYVAFIVCRSLINPRAYAAVGLDPREARRAALGNPYYHDTIRFGGEKIMPFLADAGLVGEPGMHLWRRSFLIG